MRRAALGLSLLLTACFPQAGSTLTDVHPRAAPPLEVVVSMEDFAFRPDTLRVPTGSTVVFVNRGQHPHTATESRGLFDSGVLAPGGQFRKTLDLPGEYSVYCRLHPYMVLHILVGP